MSKLLSINVGLPREIEWQGKPVRTAIWKYPVSRRVRARRLNLDGDGQADLQGHGGEQRAVLVYQLEAYHYWTQQLGWANFEFGQFGENFTVDGLADSETYVGDQYRIGGAVFEVTQPRVTCYRLGIRLNIPELPALLVAHRRPGFYLRVIQEGEVGAGDEIVKIRSDPAQMSVAEIDGLLYLPKPDYERISIASTLPALSPGWRESFEKLLSAKRQGKYDGNAGLTSSTIPPPAWKGFRSLRVADLHRETEEIVSVTFASTDNAPLPPTLPGQYVVLRLGEDHEGRPILRSYSISGEPGSGRYRISVKRGTGPGSRQIVDKTRVGDLIEVSAARGDFVLRSNPAPVVLLSAGIGVTPLLSMLYELAAPHSRPSRSVWWIHGARRAKECAFGKEVRQLLSSFTNSHYFIALSNPEPADRIGSDFDAKGHIDLELLRELSLPAEADFYLCGPAAFLRDIHLALTELGVPQERIHQELFGTASTEKNIGPKANLIGIDPASRFADAGPRVSFSHTGLTVRWDRRYKSILELAEACDVPVKWSCRTGVCHVCECGLLDGQLGYAPEPLEKPATGNALICCSIPKSSITLDL